MLNLSTLLRGHPFAIACCAIITTMTAFHFGMNAGSYTEVASVILPIFYVVTIGLFFKIGTSPDNSAFRSGLVFLALWIAFKAFVVVILVLELAVPVWDFSTQSTELARYSLPLYHVANDLAALALVLLGVGLDRLSSPHSQPRAANEP